jgi:hypothetical protein
MCESTIAFFPEWHCSKQIFYKIDARRKTMNVQMVRSRLGEIRELEK